MKKLLTASILALYLLAFLPVGTSLAQSAGCSGTPGTMTFSPASGNVYLNSSGNITVDVIVDPAGCEAGAADSTVIYSTTQMQFLGTDSNTKYINQGDEGNPANYFKNNISINEVTPGTIRMTRYIDPGSTAYTTASGKFARLTFKPLVAVGQTVDLSFNYHPGDTADFTTIAGKTQGSDLLGSAPAATLTIAQGTPQSDMTITSITPNTGDKNLAQTVTIVGTNFGTTQGTVNFAAGYPGTVTSWSNTQIVVTNPTWPTLTATTPVNVIVTAGSKSVTKTGGYTYTVAGGGDCAPNCYIPPVGQGDAPYISSIKPTSGNMNLSPEVEIFGGNFGSYDPAKSSVAIGIKGATILDWSPNRIVVQFPAEPGLTSRSTRSVTVTRADGKQATWTGFTYTTGPLPSSGAGTWIWVLLVALSLGLAGFAHYKLSAKPRQIA